MTKGQKIMSWEQRIQLEEKLRYKVPVTQIARELGFSRRTICVQTLYNYIDAGLFVKLTNDDLLEKPKRKPKTEGRSRVVHPDLPSIADRPAEIEERVEFGHWEMDLVVGPQEGSGAVLLTLTERRTRRELIFKLPDKRAASVRAVFDKLERTTPDFYQRFKTITTDNGPEFLEHDFLVKSVLGGRRFTVSYCHSYAACSAVFTVALPSMSRYLLDPKAFS